jgi:hypothetical protein
MNQRLVSAVCVLSVLAVSSSCTADNGPLGAGPLEGKAASLETTAAAPDYRSSEEKILYELSQKTDLEFADAPAPLNDVIDVIKAKHNIEIVLDKESMKQAGIDPAATLISKSLKDISLRSALKLILKDFDMTYVIDNEVLLITTKDWASTSLKTKVYDVRDLVGVKNGSPDADALSDIIQLITSTVEPESWKTDGGSGHGSLRPYTKGGVSVLVAYQTFDGHEKIAALLDELRAHRKAKE